MTLASTRTARRFAPLALLAVSGLLFTGCASSSEAADEGLKQITIGTGELSPVNDAISAVAKDHGVQIEWQSFSDWTLPNQALANSETDVNAFQHLAFLSAYNVAEDQNITPVGSTLITTWGIYSDKHDSIESIGQDATIAIPNDPSNGARTLFLLESAGLIELADNIGVYPTVDDITSNPKNLKFNAVVAQQLVNVYPDVDAIVVGAATIDQAKSIPRDQALALDDPNAESSRPYVNVVAVRGEDADSQDYAELSSFWQDQRVKDAVAEESKGNTVIVDVPTDELRATLADLEELARDLEQ
ncbi:MetQ/NlpA family ABC transporter substrate-binding protein [Glutamicibacter sp. NPDC087344]|uniref:MetQ/NlpA family ABC transporter substrate-binding protein n=1 Tax=Glutamicibacter sp. NPDC087344 TaxID=3363994 RepID=UPI00381989B0